ncbi:MAG: sortase [Candidatus Levybacteria bacterium]|nr:sortase [Candidatus Levybacteria bacterium]
MRVAILFGSFLFLLIQGSSQLFSSSSQIIQESYTISIPSLRLSLPLTYAPIKNGQWVVSNQKTAFIGEGYAEPGKRGVTVIFAHAKNSLFAKLPLLREKQTVIIYSDTFTYTYKIQERKIILPSNVSFLRENSTTNTLMIFTCFGKDDTYRILYKATLEEKIKRENVTAAVTSA